MNVKRLNMMIDYLKTVIADRELYEAFSLRDWIEEEDDNACGTVMCACGGAALTPQFQNEGFKLRLAAAGHPVEFIFTVQQFVKRTRELGKNWNGLAYPIYGDEIGYPAIMKFFNLGYGQAEWFFAADAYANLDHPARPEDVIERIQKFIETGEIGHKQNLDDEYPDLIED